MKNFFTMRNVLHDNGTQSYDFINIFKIIYLRPKGDFKLETLFKPPYQSHEPLISVFKAVTKNQGADDVGDDVADDFLWIEWLGSTIKQRFRCHLCNFDCVSFRYGHALFTFEATEVFGAKCKFVQDDRFE